MVTWYFTQVLQRLSVYTHYYIFNCCYNMCRYTCVYFHSNGKDMCAFVGAMLYFIVQHKLVYMLPCSVIFPNRVIMILGSIHSHVQRICNKYVPCCCSDTQGTHMKMRGSVIPTVPGYTTTHRKLSC